jgi:hypothetical protein
MKTGKTLNELAAEVERQSRAKADYAVNTNNLQMEAYGNNVVLRLLSNEQIDAAEPLDINGHTHRQLGTHLKIPAAYYDRMLTNAPALLAHNVNSWFRQEPSRRMVRTLDGKARAFLSDRYRRIDNMEILQAALPVIGEMPDVRFESCEITENRLYIKAVNPRLQSEIAPGDIVQAGVVLSNSEVGLGSVMVQPLIFRLVCLNGMVVNDAKTRRIHVGRAGSADENYLLYTDETLKADDRAFLMKLQDTVRAAVDEAKFSQVVDLMRDAKQAAMNTEDIPGVVKLASRDFGLSEAEENGVLSRLVEDGDMSLFGLVNAVTRHSQNVDSYDRATELESISYTILTMDRRYWNRINTQAAGISAAA